MRIFRLPRRNKGPEDIVKRLDALREEIRMISGLLDKVMRVLKEIRDAQDSLRETLNQWESLREEISAIRSHFKNLTDEIHTPFHSPEEDAAPSPPLPNGEAWVYINYPQPHVTIHICSDNTVVNAIRERLDLNRKKRLVVVNDKTEAEKLLDKVTFADNSTFGDLWIGLAFDNGTDFAYKIPSILSRRYSCFKDVTATPADLPPAAEGGQYGLAPTEGQIWLYINRPNPHLRVHCGRCKWNVDAVRERARLNRKKRIFVLNDPKEAEELLSVITFFSNPTFNDIWIGFAFEDVDKFIDEIPQILVRAGYQVFKDLKVQKCSFCFK